MAGFLEMHATSNTENGNQYMFAPPGDASVHNKTPTISKETSNALGKKRFFSLRFLYFSPTTQDAIKVYTFGNAVIPG